MPSVDDDQLAKPESFAKARADHGCYGCGLENAIGLRLRFSAAEGGVRAPFVPAPEHQGFEGIVHGGIISTVLDEAMAWATAEAGFWAITGELRVKFRRQLKVGDRTEVIAGVEGHKGRVIKVSAELVLESTRERIASASGSFFEVSPDTAERWQVRYLESDE